jgi:hypothetical protein
MTPALQLPVEFVEHEVTEQWRKWSPLRSPFHARADQPVLHHPGVITISFSYHDPRKAQAALSEGTGMHAALPVTDELKRNAEHRKVELIILPTAQAIEALKKEDLDRTSAILHVTC